MYILWNYHNFGGVVLALEIQLSGPVPNTESPVMFNEVNYEKKPCPNEPVKFWLITNFNSQPQKS